LKLNPTAIPHGTRTYIFEEAAHKRFLEDTIHLVLRSRGFQEIVTPPFEYHESAIIGLNEDERNRLIGFSEGDSGRRIALRADITSQVARSAATHLSERPFPLRLCYTGMVFRHARKGHGEQYVLNQSGFEIMGHAGPEADIEVIMSLTDTMWEIGLTDFSISLGHAGFIADHLEGLEEPICEKIRKALVKKDKGGIKEILSSASASAEKTEMIIALTELYGGPEVFNKAAALPLGESSRAALENLKSVYDALDAAGLGEKVTIDLGEMRGFGYYTGINIELFSQSGLPIGTGGRYDHLVGRFGSDMPAVGFGFDIDAVAETIRSAPDAPDAPVAPVWRGSDVLLLGRGEEIEEAAADMREAGVMVTRPLVEISEEEAKSYAEKMTVPHILVPAKGSGKSAGFKWISEEGVKADATLESFIEHFFSLDIEE
jgi:ATP phosphoribosyltransferase regulatory subunit